MNRISRILIGQLIIAGVIGTHHTFGNTAKEQLVPGAAFRDLLLPIPIHNELRSDLWGAEGVVPRDPDNGIEHPDWSYWGGRPVKGKDGNYHMLVVRWPEDAEKGHMAWPASTVAYAVADKPTGPYRVVRDKGYEYKNGSGHNADIVFLNDGRYLLYSLINWKPTLLISDSMSGPWERVGVMQIEYDAETLNDDREYQVQRNLSGLQLEDGRMLFMSKFGRMILSEDGLLGPYRVLTDTINENLTIPEKYRHSNYEDPVIWRDEVQFHALINAFYDFRAIYLRSPDGIHWTYDPGLAFTPADSTVYEDGTRTAWYKLERPHVLQDEYGRATHLSLAVIDVAKREDLANDSHSSKNLIIPLVVHKRLKLLNETPVTTDTEEIRALIRSEEGFDAGADIDLSSLRFGASQEVDYGRGSPVLKTEPHPNGLILVFSGTDSGLNKGHYTGKLLGRTKHDKLIIAFAGLASD